MERSPMGDHQKYAILIDELTRRLSTIDQEFIKMGEIVEIIEVFIQEMKSSGYWETVIGGIKGWKKRQRIREREGQG